MAAQLVQTEQLTGGVLEVQEVEITVQDGDPVSSITGTPTGVAEILSLTFLKPASAVTVSVTRTSTATVTVYDVTESGDDTGSPIIPGCVINYAATINDGETTDIIVRTNREITVSPEGQAFQPAGFTKSGGKSVSIGAGTDTYTIVDGDAVAFKSGLVLADCTSGAGLIYFDDDDNRAVDETRKIAIAAGDYKVFPVRCKAVKHDHVSGTLAVELDVLGH